MCLCTVLLEFDLSFCRGGVWCMQDYVSICQYYVIAFVFCTAHEPLCTGLPRV